MRTMQISRGGAKGKEEVYRVKGGPMQWATPKKKEVGKTAWRWGDFAFVALNTQSDRRRKHPFA